MALRSDVVALERLARVMRHRAEQVEQLLSELNGRVTRTTWDSPRARSFRGLARQNEDAGRRIAADLHETANRIESFADWVLDDIMRREHAEREAAERAAAVEAAVD